MNPLLRVVGQAACVPVALMGRDISGSAMTGKTCCRLLIHPFMLHLPMRTNSEHSNNMESIPLNINILTSASIAGAPFCNCTVYICPSCCQVLMIWACRLGQDRGLCPAHLRATVVQRPQGGGHICAGADAHARAGCTGRAACLQVLGNHDMSFHVVIQNSGIQQSDGVSEAQPQSAADDPGQSPWQLMHDCGAGISVLSSRIIAT